MRCSRALGILWQVGWGSSLPPKSLRQEFETLARDLERPLLAIGSRLSGGDADLAQDLVQEALKIAYVATLEGRFCAGPGSLKWLARVMSNVCLAQRRKHSRLDDSQPAAERLDAAACPAPSPESQALRSIERQRLDLGLAELPAEQRECVELVDLGGLAYPEAALVLQIPVGTVRSRLSRARLRLASILQEP
ncbi:MAG: RNA polymerase sigma factor [Fimbriimonadaceae bacterium]